jgi:hypothetical protein
MGEDMELKMQSQNGRPQELPTKDAFMTTGRMGDCVSIIVVFGFDLSTLTYKNLRGWHGLGGVEVINMNAMLIGVPNNPKTKVLVLPGSLQQSNTAKESNMEYVKNGLLNNAKTSVTVQYIQSKSNYRVDRKGLVTPA